MERLTGSFGFAVALLRNHRDWEPQKNICVQEPAVLLLVRISSWFSRFVSYRNAM